MSVTVRFITYALQENVIAWSKWQQFYWWDGCICRI